MLNLFLSQLAIQWLPYVHRSVLDIDLGLDEDSVDGLPDSEWSSHMVRGTWFSKNHKIFHYGLPTPLLDHLRRVRNSAWQQSNILVNSLLHTVKLLQKTLKRFTYSSFIYSISLGHRSGWTPMLMYLEIWVLLLKQWWMPWVMKN